jgi:hypothetical protein
VARAGDVVDLAPLGDPCRLDLLHPVLVADLHLCVGEPRIRERAEK